MHELKINHDREQDLILRSLITHAFKCKDTIKLHNETKAAIGDAAIVHIAEQAKKRDGDCFDDGREVFRCPSR